MITDRTVFILGAGASRPYGFPTALELRKDIIYDFAKKYMPALADHKQTNEFSVSMHPDMKALIEQFKLSSTKSIDLFLSRNNKYYEYGKEIISFLIAQYEIESKFREDVIDPKQDWYFEIFDILTRNISDPEKLLTTMNENKVSFITFNYDRSLEHFLYTSFFNSFTTKRNELKQIMSLIKIIHLYGKIAPLPWEEADFKWPYGVKNYFENLNDFIENIRIIFEDRKDGVQEAKEEILAARNIYFLGFGYADENLQALEFSGLLNGNHRIYGTGMGLTENERNKIKSKLKGKNSLIYPDFISIEDCDSVMLLRKHL